MTSAEVDARIRWAAFDYIGWIYGTGAAAHTATHVPGCPSPSVVTADRPSTTDCCTFVAGLLAAAFPLGKWTPATYRDILVIDPSQFWSPPRGAVAAGVAIDTSIITPDAWHIVQGWRTVPPGPLAGGHTFLWRADSSSDGGMVLEASTAGGRVQARRTTWSVQRGRFAAGIRFAVVTGGGSG